MYHAYFVYERYMVIGGEASPRIRYIDKLMYTSAWKLIYAKHREWTPCYVESALFGGMVALYVRTQVEGTSYLSRHAVSLGLACLREGSPHNVGIA